MFSLIFFCQIRVLFKPSNPKCSHSRTHGPCAFYQAFFVRGPLKPSFFKDMNPRLCLSFHEPYSLCGGVTSIYRRTVYTAIFYDRVVVGSTFKTLLDARNVIQHNII